MDGVPAVYLGKIISKAHFRTFIYGADGSRKLVESWDAYERHMQTGLWFATVEESHKKVEEKPVVEEEVIFVKAKKEDDPTPKKARK